MSEDLNTRTYKSVHTGEMWVKWWKGKVTSDEHIRFKKGESISVSGMQ